MCPTHVDDIDIRKKTRQSAGVSRLYKELGHLLHKHRRKAGLSQEALAKRVNMSRTSITNIERGRQTISLHLLYAFADALGVEPDVLLPDRKTLLGEAEPVTVDLSALPPDVAEFVRREAQEKK